MAPTKSTEVVADGGAGAAIETTGTDLATITEGHLLTLTEVDRNNVAAFLETTRQIEDHDSDQTTVEILARILAAESVEDVLAPQAPVALKTLQGFPLSIDSVRWMKSDFAEGAGMYALIKGARTDTGETFLATCGGTNVLAQLFVLDKLGAFPTKVKITTASKPTANGYYPLWLTPDA